MADLYFYINDEERVLLFQFLKNLDIYLVPDKKYSTAKFEMVQNSSDFIEKIQNETVGFFAISKLFSIYSLYLERNEFIKDEEAFFVQKRYGGPYIDIGLYRGFAEDAPIKYKCTWLSYYPKYVKLQEVYEEFKASDELKFHFKQIELFLKSKCQSIRINSRNYWVSKKILDELKIPLTGGHF